MRETIRSHPLRSNLTPLFLSLPPQDHQTSVSHGVPGSAARRNPTFGPTQSVNRSHSKHPQQQQQQQWSQASHSQQTPAPLRQKGVPLGMTGMGGGFSQKFGAGGGGSPMVLGSVKGKGKAREVSERRESCHGIVSTRLEWRVEFDASSRHDGFRFFER